MQQDLHTLGVDLGHLEDSPFAKHLRSLQVLGTDSMFGIVPEGFGISYQHPVSPHGFKTYISPNIVQCGTDASKPVLPTWPVLFTSSNTYKLGTEFLNATSTSLLQVLFHLLHICTLYLFSCYALPCLCLRRAWF